MFAMFGNHPLPNIAPSLLCWLPPPTHIPPPLLSPLPFANARTGHARACSSPTAACAPPLVEGCGQTTRHVTAQACHITVQVPPPLPTATRVRHLTANTTRLRHVTVNTTCVHHVTAHKQHVRHVTDDDDDRNRRVGVRRSE